MKSIQFLGAAGSVTGSGTLLTAKSGETILVDFGLYQGNADLELQNQEPLTFDPSQLQAVLLTHAHLDHCGRLPVLLQHGFTGKIFATEPTKMITGLSLMDAAKIAFEEKRENALYSEEQAMQTFEQMVAIRYDQTIAIGPFSVTFRNAGHILGSASIEITNTQRPGTGVVCSGDLGNTPEDLIPPTQYIKRAKYVVMEATYGDKIHPREHTVEMICHEINQVEQNQGVLLIPAFSIERTQELIHIIGHLKADGKVLNDTPVYIDSPMAIEVTQIFEKYPAYYNRELAHEADPFSFPNLVCTKSVEQSKSIMHASNPKVIIAGSGMMSGGRILHHIKHFIGQPSTRLLIVGYQAENTLGRKIEDGAKTVIIHNEQVVINATITKMESLSSHADQAQLLRWFKHIHGVEQVFIVHGDDQQRATLAQKLKEETSIQKINIPEKNQLFLLS